MEKARRNLLAMLLVPMVLVVAACSNQSLVYNRSVDVHPYGWAPTDTLVFPIHVDRYAHPAFPIERHVPYCLGLLVRYERFYPCGAIQLHIQLDDQEEQSATLMLGDVKDMPEGNAWGSLCQKSFEEDDQLYLFPDSGNYRLKVWPDTLTQHVVSITATLE